MIYRLTMTTGGYDIKFDFTDYSRMVFFMQTGLQNYFPEKDYCGDYKELEMRVTALPEEEEF